MYRGMRSHEVCNCIPKTRFVGCNRRHQIGRTRDRADDERSDERKRNELAKPWTQSRMAKEIYCSSLMHRLFDLHAN